MIADEYVNEFSVLEHYDPDKLSLGIKLHANRLTVQQKSFAEQRAKRIQMVGTAHHNHWPGNKLHTSLRL